MKLKLKRITKFGVQNETEEFVLDSDVISEYSKASNGTMLKIKDAVDFIYVTADYEKLNKILEVVEV